jgi:methyltransferase (TIGR00027 family)
MTLKRSVEQKESNTAGYTCFCRACAHLEEDELFRGADYMANAFLPETVKSALGVPSQRKLIIKDRVPLGIYEYIMARTKHLDGIFLDALKNKFDQIVLLGAGYDSRALRFREHNQGTRIFELDIFPTQKLKREIIDREQIALPKELIFVPIDFNRQSLSEVLSAAGYEKDQKNLFLWEGVSMYLTQEAVDNTLSVISSTSALGSLVAFDYIFASVLRRENRYFGEQVLYETVSAVGEGFTFGVEEGMIGEFLAERGFKVEQNQTATDLEKHYLSSEDGNLFGRINGIHSLVVASCL